MACLNWLDTDWSYLNWLKIFAVQRSPQFRLQMAFCVRIVSLIEFISECQIFITLHFRCFYLKFLNWSTFHFVLDKSTIFCLHTGYNNTRVCFHYRYTKYAIQTKATFQLTFTIIYKQWAPNSNEYIYFKGSWSQPNGEKSPTRNFFLTFWPDF